MAMTRPYHFVFLGLADRRTGDPAGDYARRFFSGRHADPSAIPGIDTVRLASLDLVDREAELRRITEAAAAKLARQEECLLRGVRRQWAVPEGERLLDLRAEALASTCLGFARGTVAVVRRTDTAVVACLLPHLRVDIETGVLAEEPPAPPRPRPGLRPPLQRAATEGMGGAKLALQVAGTLAFALPEPWGALCAGGITFIEGMLPGEKSHLVKDVIAGIAACMEQKEIADCVAVAKTLMETCEKHIVTMAVTDPSATVVTTVILPEIESGLSPSVGVPEKLTTLTQAALIDREGALDALVLCVSAYLFAVVFRLQLHAYVAHRARADNDMAAFNEANSSWRYLYTQYAQDVTGDGRDVAGWATRVAAIVDHKTAERLAMIGPVHRGQLPGHVECAAAGGGGAGCGVVPGPDGWCFNDAAAGTTDWTNHFHEDTKVDTQYVEHKDQAEAERAAYAGMVAASLDAKYADARKAVLAWRDAISSWNEHLPPAEPKGAPAATGQWAAIAPAGSAWATHATVSYAVQFLNSSGPSLPGPWSDAIAIRARSGPTLAIPTDPLLMATRRWILRRFDNGPPRLVGLVPDNTTTTYTDAT